MSTAAAADPEPVPRLNPFAFPSNTAFRFLLLIVTVLGTSLFTYNWIYTGLENTALVEKYLACLEQDRLGLAAATTLDERTAVSRAFGECTASANRPGVNFAIAGVAFLILVTLALYLAAPRWQLRRRRLVPFSAEDDPDIAAELDRLVSSAGLRHSPRFVWNALDPIPSGLAFGRPGKRYVGLSGALVTRFYTDRPAFRAVVLHELAHLRNRDVDLAYLTVAVWWAFLLAAVLPFGLTLIDESAHTIWVVGWRLAALTALVYLTRNAVLRSREFYADVRASLDEPAGIRSVLASSTPRLRRRRDRFVGLHPEPAERLAAVQDTDRLFSIRALEYFAAGVATTIAYEKIATIVTAYELDSISAMWWAALAFAPLAAAVLAVGVWRGEFAEIARGRRRRSEFAAGAALGAGFLIGQELALTSAISREDVVLGSSLGNVLTAVGVVVGLGLFAAWLAATGELWLPVAGVRSPLGIVVAGVVTSAFVLTVAMGTFFVVFQTRGVIEVSTAGTAAEHARVGAVVWAGSNALYQFVWDPEIAVFVHRAAVWPAIVALWAFPGVAMLLGAARKRRRLSWGALGEQWVVLEQPRLPVRRAVRIGLVGAAVVLAASIILRAALHAGVSEATRSHDEFFLAFKVWTVSLGLLAMALVACISAAMSAKMGVLLGLFAAAPAGVAAAVTLFAYPSAASCIDILKLNSAAPCAWTVDASFARQTLEQMLTQGTLAALIGGGIGAVVGAAFRRGSSVAPSPVVAA